MPNSDNTFGTYNKQTRILSQIDDGSTAMTIHADVDAAKSFFYTADALTVFDECCTNIQWALVAETSPHRHDGDNVKLKLTFDFGTKGTAGITTADDWSGQYNSRQSALATDDNWANNQHTTEESTDHLF